MREYEEILSRCEKQGIDTTNCHIYVDTNHLDGEMCGSPTLSQDKFWLCIPTKEYSPDFDEDIFVPICYEIKDTFTTYIQNDDMWYLRKIYLLYKRRV